MEVVNFKMGDVEINNLTQRTIGILGGKGTGKTTILKMFVDNLTENYPRMPVIIFDPLAVVSIPGVQGINILRKNVNDGKQAGKLVNEMVKKHKKVCIRFIDLLGFEIVEFMETFLQEINMKNGAWVLDEVHEITPETGMGGSGGYSREMERIVRHTRNKNNLVFVTTQRPAFTSKKVLALVDYYIFFRVTYPIDLEVLQKLIKDKEIVESIQSKGFLQGYAVDFDPNSGKFASKKK